MLFKRLSTSLAVLLFLAPQLVLAQQPGTLSGIVKDPAGGPLPGVGVEVKGPASKSSVTDPQGRWRIEGLTPGNYQVSFKLLNFASILKKGVSVTAGAEASVDAVLPLMATADIVVTGQRTFKDLADLEDPEGLVGVADAATEGIVTSRELASRPVRRAADLLETVPGVIISQHGGEGKANQYSSAASTWIMAPTWPSHAPTCTPSTTSSICGRTSRISSTTP